MAAAALLCASVADAQPAPTTGYELSPFEERLLDRALQKHQATLLTYAQAEGRPITEILIEPEDVFTPDDLWPDVLNIFHFTSRPYIIRREVLLDEGDPFQSDLVAQTARNLRAQSAFYSVALVVPISGPTPETVRLLVLTKDIWSLRANTGILFVGDTLSFLSLSLSENNVFGFQKEGAFTFLLEQDVLSFGQLANDRRILGSRVAAGERARLIFNRESNDYEGYDAAFSVGVPLYSLQQTWAWRADVAGLREIGRLFEGANLRTFDNPDTAEVEQLPFAWRARTLSASAQITRSFGSYFKKDVSFGHDLTIQRYTYGEDAAQRDAAGPVAQRFEQTLLPRSERASAFYLNLDLYVADFVQLKNFDTFALQEDVRLGPAATFQIDHADPLWGSQYRYERFSAVALWRILLGDRDDQPSRRADLLTFGASAETRLQRGNFQDNELSLSARNYSPVFAGLRAVTRAAAVWRVADRQNRLASLGGDTALRGFDAGAFLGRSRLIGNLELRTMPWELYTFHFGGTLFYDVGGVSDQSDLSDLTLLHAAGLGIRFLNPASNRIVFRVDWGVALNPPPGTPIDTALLGATFPGKLTIGFEQAF